MRPAYDVRLHRWREGGRFIPASRGRRRSDRLTRGIELAVEGHVVTTGEGWRVWSADGAHLYTVSSTGCDCPDAVYRGVVYKHRFAVGLRERKLTPLLRESAE